MGRHSCCTVKLELRPIEAKVDISKSFSELFLKLASFSFRSLCLLHRGIFWGNNIIIPRYEDFFSRIWPWFLPVSPFMVRRQSERQNGGASLQ